MPEQPSAQVPGQPDAEAEQPVPPAGAHAGDGVSAAITAARSAITAASDAAARAASRHAAQRSRLAALLTAQLLPDAASLVFSRGEDVLTAETTITLVHIRAGDGRLLWYSEWTDFAEHPDARDLDPPPDLDARTLDDIQSQLATAYDASPGHFDTTADGAEVMPAANLLLLSVPGPRRRKSSQEATSSRHLTAGRGALPHRRRGTTGNGPSAARQPGGRPEPRRPDGRRATRPGGRTRPPDDRARRTPGARQPAPVISAGQTLGGNIYLSDRTAHPARTREETSRQEEARPCPRTARSARRGNAQERPIPAP